MDILDKLSNISEEKGLFGELLQTYNQRVAPQMKSAEYLNNNVGWVYACVSVIADEVAKIGLKLYKLNGENIEEVEEHPALDTLYKANNFTTKYDLFWLIAQYIQLTGEAPLFCIKEGGIPTQLFLLRPDRLTIKAGVGEEFIGGYVYRNEAGRDIPIENSEMVFIKRPDPTNQFRGLSVLKAAARVVDIENYSEEYNKNYFYNGASSGILFKTEQKLNKDVRERFRAQIDENYRGVRNAHKYLILESGLDATPLTANARDMEFFNQLNWTRDKILGIFRVPRTALGITDDVNRANAEATDYVFAKRTIKPLLQMIVDQLNEFYLPMFGDGDNLWLDFEDPVPQDINSKVLYYNSGLQNGFLTPNEVRGMENLPAIEEPEADQIFARDRLLGSALGGNSADQVKLFKDIKKKIYARNKRSTKKILEKAIKAEITESVKSIKGTVKDLVIKDIEKRDKEATAWSQTKKDANWLAVIKRADRNEIRMRTVIAKQFAKQADEILKGKKKAINIRQWLLNPDKEKDIWMQVLVPVISDIVKSEGQAVLDTVISDGNFQDRNDVVRNFIYNHSRKIVKGIDEVTNERIKRVLADNVDANEAVISRKIRDMFEDMEVSRAKMIARTETFKAVNFATEEAYKQSDVVIAKEFYTAEDERVCPDCEGLDGKQFDIGEDVFNGVDNPPIHPDCRCGLTPVLVGQKQYDEITRNRKKNDLNKENQELKDRIDAIDKKVEDVKVDVNKKVEEVKNETENKLEGIKENVNKVLGDE